MPLRASTAVLALAYVAIFMPRYPHRMDVVAPSRKAIMEKRPFLTWSARVRVSSGVTEPSRAKISTAMMICLFGEEGRSNGGCEVSGMRVRLMCAGVWGTQHRRKGNLVAAGSHHEDAHVLVLREKEAVGSFCNGFLDVGGLLDNLQT